MRRVAVLGLGNSVLGDDSVGLRVAELLADILRDQVLPREVEVEVFQDEAGGWEILDLIEGFDSLVLVDSILDETRQPGEFTWYPARMFTSPRLSGIHSTDVFSAIEFASRHGMRVPGDVHVMGICVKEVYTFTESCSAPVAEAVPLAAKEILVRIHDISSVS